MPYTVTLAELRTRAQDRADMVNSGFVTTAQWNAYAQSSWNRLWRKLVKSGLSYVTESSQTISTTGLTDTYALPADHAVTLAVDYQANTEQYIELEEVMLKERNNYPATGSAARGFRLAGSNIILYPKPPAGQTYRHLYVARPAVLSLDGDTIDCVMGLEEWIVWDMAIRALMKEESDVAWHSRERDALWAEFDEDVEMRMLAKNRRVVATTDRSLAADELADEVDPDRRWYR